MWIVDLSKDQPPTVFVNFGKPIRISGIRFWNFNKNPQESSKGVKRMKIVADINDLTKEIGGAFLFKAPGHCHTDFS